MSARTVNLYNTLTRKVEPLEPITPGEVKLYCCGPTVYNYQHIGNLRTYIFEDVLVRTLRYAGYSVQHVMNITDVGHLVSDADEGEDKMALAAKREGRKSEEIAKFYTDIFFEHCAWLHIIRPNVVCNATDHISQMIALTERLIENGFAYISGGNVYFDVEKFQSYGELARLDPQSLRAGARIEVDSQKKNPFDFALWFTKSKFENQELQWDSPWGRGYPGWHIECSAMAMHYLGESFDIHCGGIDHIPVHHTNEIAQSEAATGKQFARIWLHGGFLVAEREKMSKSKGEFLTLDVVRERGFDAIAYRLFCLGGTYRNELSWSWDAIASAERALTRMKRSVADLRSKGVQPAATIKTSASQVQLREFEAAVFDDLSMPRALAAFHATLGDENIPPEEKLYLLENFDTVLGLGVAEWKEEKITVPAEVSDLIEQRETARKEKDWAKADEIRDKISALGYTIEDSPTGAVVRKK